MKGTAYYRLGDVIRDSEGYYWVCVRPSFAPDKGNSHWMNIFNASKSGNYKQIPSDNVYDTWNNQAKYNNLTILLPTKLPYDRKHIYNLSNFIWALINVDKYKDAVLNGAEALGGFDYNYHGEKFLHYVAQYWDEKDADGYTVWERLFNRTHEKMKKLTEMHLYYQGYSWVWGNTGNVWRYVSKGYQPKYTGKEKEDKFDIDFVQHGFNVKHFAGTPDTEGKPYKQFLEDGSGGALFASWVVRYKSGDELMTSGSYSPYRQITSRDNMQKDIYRFNEKQGIAAGENVLPVQEGDLHEADIVDGKFAGVPHYKLGDVYKDQAGHLWFVVESSGNEFNESDLYSDYSYLVSFDAVTAVDGSASKLPVRNLAIKATIWLDKIYQYCAGKTDASLREGWNELNSKQIAYNIIQYAHVDPRKLFLATMPLSGNGYQQSTHLACVAYRDGDDNRLLRFINECTTKDRQLQYFFWDRYRDPQTLKFTQSIMRLADISKADSINKYANDAYATSPISRTTDPNADEKAKRQARTQPDNRALDAANYLWKNGAFVTDALSMWNDRVLYFSVDKVLDRGDSNYASLTAGGLTLTKVATNNWIDEDTDENHYTLETGIEMQWGNSTHEAYELTFLNGVQWNVPAWNVIQEGFAIVQ